MSEIQTLDYTKELRSSIRSQEDRSVLPRQTQELLEQGHIAKVTGIPLDEIHGIQAYWQQPISSPSKEWGWHGHSNDRTTGYRESGHQGYFGILYLGSEAERTRQTKVLLWKTHKSFIRDQIRNCIENIGENNLLLDSTNELRSVLGSEEAIHWPYFNRISAILYRIGTQRPDAQKHVQALGDNLGERAATLSFEPGTLYLMLTKNIHSATPTQQSSSLPQNDVFNRGFLKTIPAETE